MATRFCEFKEPLAWNVTRTGRFETDVPPSAIRATIHAMLISPQNFLNRTIAMSLYHIIIIVWLPLGRWRFSSRPSWIKIRCGPQNRGHGFIVTRTLNTKSQICPWAGRHLLKTFNCHIINQSFQTVPNCTTCFQVIIWWRTRQVCAENIGLSPLHLVYIYIEIRLQKFNYTVTYYKQNLGNFVFLVMSHWHCVYIFIIFLHLCLSIIMSCT